MSRNLPAWFLFGPAEDAVRAVMERPPQAVLRHEPPRSRKWLARLLCWAGLHGPEELRYLPQTALLWRVCRRCHRTVSLRVLGSDTRLR